MKKKLITHILLFAIFSLLIVPGCKKSSNIPPPGFYEFIVTKSDGCVYFKWNFNGFYNDKYGVSIRYYLNNTKKIQTVFGENSMTIKGLTNTVTYAFTVVAYDRVGNSSDGFIVRATPNTPFVVVSPTSSDGYSLEDGKVRIDLRFNRPADTSSLNVNTYYLTDIIQLKSGSNRVAYSYKWLENGEVLSILTNNTKESFCSSFPCNLSLKLHFVWFGASTYFGLYDTKGMKLDGDKNGLEMGDGILNFVLE
ncbi:MAG: fibronectin type III domain-containing protein [Bacteroidales bacterium]|nr:fibronectin type III domain-containing protein [Bacteroidales bacterium]